MALSIFTLSLIGDQKSQLQGLKWCWLNLLSNEKQDQPDGCSLCRLILAEAAETHRSFERRKCNPSTTRCQFSSPAKGSTHTKVFSMLITKVPILFPCRRKHTHKSVQHADNQGRAESKALCAIIVQKHVAMAELHQYKKPCQK